MIQFFLSAWVSLHFLRTIRKYVGQRRPWLFHLALNWVIGILLFAGLAILSHVLSYWNLWTWLWSPVREVEPAGWIFWLGEANLWPLVFCGLIGFLPSFVTGWGGWMWIFVPAALFPGVLSLPGAWMMIFAERFGLWCRAFFSFRGSQERKDLSVRLLLSFIFVCLVAIAGPSLRGMIQAFLPADGFNPDLRFIQSGVGLCILVVIETVISLILFHFYYAGFRLKPSESVS